MENEMGARGENWNCSGKYAGAGSCTGPATLRCGSCGAPNYCSRAHQMAHWKDHREECDRLAQQMERSITLHDFPFSFIEETTQLVDFGAVTICSFLESRGLHLRGLWQGECECDDSMRSSMASSEWQLPSKTCPCTDPSRSATDQLLTWTDYYNWRHLPFDSPVALLLHWPLTLYYAFWLVTTRMPALTENGEEECRIHYLGPSKELKMLEVFGELLALLPGRRVHIDMIGPAIPASRDGEVVELCGYPKCSEENCECKVAIGEELLSLNGGDTNSQTRQVTIKLWRGLYHDRFLDVVSVPHFILAPNAGIPAFSSWEPTIRLISRLKLPAIFSDYCEEAADLAVGALYPAHSDTLTYPVQVNPFRQPLSPRDKLFNLPTFSNCFLFGIN